MSPLNLIAFVTWTLSAEGGACALKVDREVEWCVNGDCSRVVRSDADRPDQWLLAPSGTAIRWTAPDTAELVCEGSPVVLRAKRTSVGVVDAPEVPWSEVAGVLGAAPDVVVPGAWLGGSRACVEGAKAWLFDPFDRDRPDVFVAGEGEGWVVSKGRSGVAMCAGGRLGGVFPDKDAGRTVEP